MSLYNFYRSDEWESLLKVLKNERVNESGYIICEQCGRPILRAYDCIGHHIEPLTEENYNDANISLNPDNIQLIHHRCHNKIHDRLKIGYVRQVFIVYGSPLAGKTSYVKDAMAEGDLILDIDNIWEAVSGQPRYVKPKRLNAVVFGIRDNILEAIKYRKGKWLNAYVIGSYPYSAERNRLADELGARLIHIDTDEAECLRRLKDDQERDKEEWTGYIHDYFLKSSGGY